jgi:hypothetical protein
MERGVSRGINEFKKSYQPGTNVVKDEYGDLLALFHNVLKNGKIICQLFNVRGLNDIRQRKMNTDEPLIPEPNTSDFKIGIGKLKS